MILDAPVLLAAVGIVGSVPPGVRRDRFGGAEPLNRDGAIVQALLLDQP